MGKILVGDIIIVFCRGLGFLFFKVVLGINVMKIVFCEFGEFVVLFYDNCFSI